MKWIALFLGVVGLVGSAAVFLIPTSPTAKSVFARLEIGMDYKTAKAQLEQSGFVYSGGHANGEESENVFTRDGDRILICIAYGKNGIDYKEFQGKETFLDQFRSWLGL